MQHTIMYIKQNLILSLVYLDKKIMGTWFH